MPFVNRKFKKFQQKVFMVVFYFFSGKIWRIFVFVCCFFLFFVFHAKSSTTKNFGMYHVKAFLVLT